MKTLKPFLIGLLLCTGVHLNAQWNTFGNFVNPGDYIGSTNNEFFDVHQNSLRRARFRNVDWLGYNGSPVANNASRMHFGINGNNQVPFSMMHLGYNIGTNLWRPWMNVGTTYGDGEDIMHVGLMRRPVGSTGSFANFRVDAVVAWGCNDENFIPSAGPDNLRFLFITPVIASSPGADSAEGRETMRITPMGNVGMGNFSQMPEGIGAIYGQPRARLDVQFRGQLPENTDNTAVKILNDVRSGLGPFSVKRALLAEVRNSENEQINVSECGNFFATGAKTNYGVVATVQGIGGDSYGVSGRAELSDGDSQHFGVQGIARGAWQNIGVDGQANHQQSSGSFTAGVRGSAFGGSSNNDAWAGYFIGDVFATGNISWVSDMQFKENVEPIESATALLSQIQAKTYFFNQEYEQFGFNSLRQYGVIAQELQEVLPELVLDIHAPGVNDEDGNFVEGIPFKAVRYTDLISILIAGFQEQNHTISTQSQQLTAQQDQLDQLLGEIETINEQFAEMQASFVTALNALEQAKSNLDNCCQQQPAGMATPEGEKMQLGQNIPNPFTDNTRIDFTLPDAAQVVLEISDSQGRKLERIIDGHMAAGTHSTTWNGGRYSPGMYYYSLYADGELLTKKMIKR